MTPPVANQDPKRVGRHRLVSYSITRQHDRAEADRLLTEHLAHLQRLHRNGEVLLAGPIASSDGRLDGGFALFRSPDPDAVQAFIDEDPAVGRLFTTTARRWTRSWARSGYEPGRPRKGRGRRHDPQALRRRRECP